jgi:transcriptional regulator
VRHRSEQSPETDSTSQNAGTQQDRGGEVIKGTLDLLILRTLQAGPMHGWGITELIESGSDNLLSINQGSLYPALYRLVRRGLLRSTWKQTENNRRARYYELTRDGRAVLGEERATWERLSRGVNLVLEGGAP